MDLKRRFDDMIGRQQRRPSGLAGRVIGERMARQHAPETLWTVDLLGVAPRDRVLEIGCGAGRALQLLATRATEGHVTGIDVSPTMVRAAGRRNARAVVQGRVAVQQGDVAQLPFPDRQFDKILSIHTLYFWTDPARAVAEVARVLTPGGRLVLTFSPGRVGAEDDAGLRALVMTRIIPAIQGAGFTAIAVERGPDSRQYRSLAIVGATG